MLKPNFKIDDKENVKRKTRTNNELMKEKKKKNNHRRSIETINQ